MFDRQAGIAQARPVEFMSRSLVVGNSEMELTWCSANRLKKFAADSARGQGTRRRLGYGDDKQCQLRGEDSARLSSYLRDTTLGAVK